MAAINPISSTAARIARTEAYAEQVRRRFAACVGEILSLHKTLPTLGEGEMYSFDAQSVKMRKEVEVLLRRLHSSATLAIQKGISAEWEEANKACDSLLSSIFGKKVLSAPEFSAWTQRNKSAMQAFIERSDNGLNLSDKVWKNVRRLRDEMEVAITISVGEGESAATMSRRVRAYLNDPDLMFRRFQYKDPNTGEWKRKWKKRVRDEATGKTSWIDCDRDTYKTGKGVYKSSAKNAMRLARTETNIAYRRADHERWQQMDFVLGQRVSLSKSHPKPDICDTLKGDYPKELILDGWHPQCFCVVTPILASEEEMMKEAEAMQKGEYYKPLGKQVTEYPQEFKKWVTEHSEQIADARSRGTEPYFIKNNSVVIDGILKSGKSHSVTSPFESNRKDAAAALGVKAGVPMTFEEANKLRGNPHYADGKQYRVNCQTCVVANEMRRRGLDIEALGNTKGSELEKLSFHTEMAWIDRNGNMPASNLVGARRIKRFNLRGEECYTYEKTCSTRKDLVKQLEKELSEEGRYHIKWVWEKGNCGHIITAERIGGKVRYYDPQNGKIISNFVSYIGGISLRRGINWLRVDNLRVNIGVAKKVLSKPTAAKAGKAASGGTSAKPKHIYSQDECNFVLPNGGRVITPRKRFEKANSEKNQNAIFAKELRMANRFASNGHIIEFAEDDKGSYDVLFDGIKADFKSTSSPVNIVKYAKHAIFEQGAELVLFEFTEWNSKFIEEIVRLKRLGIHGKYLHPNQSIYTF